MEIQLSPFTDVISIKKTIADIENVLTDDILEIDLSKIIRIHPIGLMAVSQYLKYLKDNKGKKIIFKIENAKVNIISYLNTIGFFRYFEAESVKNINVNPDKSFIVMNSITYGALHTDQLDHYQVHNEKILIQQVIEDYSDNYSKWIFNEVEPVTSYCLREIIRNVFEHAKTGNCSIFGQIYKKGNRIEICVADSGCGIKNSLSKKYGNIVTTQDIFFYNSGSNKNCHFFSLLIFLRPGR